MRASYRCSRTQGSARHNDRDFDTSKVEHIRDDDTRYNFNWHCFRAIRPDMTFEQVEELYYSKSYKGYVEALNERYKASGHPERCKTTLDLLKGRKTRPEEFILQVGSLKDGFPSPMVLKKCLDDYVERLTDWSKEHGHCMQILSASIHVDETTPHIHVRRVWNCKDKYGHLSVNQNQALKQAGIERPDLSKPEGRYNNRKMSFDVMARQMWQDVLKSHGLEIETTPLPNRKHYSTENYINNQIAFKSAELKRLSQEVERLETKLNKLDKQVKWTQKLRDKQHALDFDR